MDTVTAPERPPLTRMLSRPFGVDEHGRPIDHGTGKLIMSSIEWMTRYVEQEAVRSHPDNPDQAAAAARDKALDRLIAMLNDAIDDPRYRITREYLLNENNRYSYEFRLFVSEYASRITGDPDFAWHAGELTIPPALALLARPLGTQRVYALLPQLAGKLVKTDLRVVDTTPTTAILEWRGAEQAMLVPEPHREAYIRYACTTYRAAFANVPQVVMGLQKGEVTEVRCQADGAECCEWHFTWQPAQERAGRRLLAAGAASSAALAALAVRSTPVGRVLMFAGAALPGVLAWHRQRTGQLTARATHFERQLREERDLAEEEYDRSDRANSELQLANIELTQRFSELSMLHELATSLSATLDLDEILDRALESVVSHLPFQRALVMLADHDAGALSAGRAVGGDEAIRQRLSALSVPLDNTSSSLVRGFLADAPLVYEGFGDEPENRDVARSLGVTSFMTVPLIASGRRVGLLAVDNGTTGRALDASTAPLLMTLGSQVAVAIDKAALYAQVEAHNRTLEERVAARTAELEATTRSLAEELEERRRLRQRELEYLEQVNQVVAAAGAVEAQTFDPATLDTAAARDDELGQLARTFRRMAGNVIQREEKLRLEVEHLRIEIDVARQARQVAAIVDTEYFRTLRSEAKDLRRMIGDG